MSAPTSPATAPLSPRTLVEFVLLAALWGSSFMFTRIAAAEFGALTTAGLRVGLAALFLVPIMVWRGHGPAFRRHWRPILIIGMLNSGLPFALFAWAVLSITTGFAAILNATVPLFGALVAWIWLKDRLAPWRVVGLALGFTGVAFLALHTPGGVSFKPGGSGWAVMACLAACVCYALAASGTKKYLTGVPPLATSAGSQIGASLGLALPMVWYWPEHTPSAGAWAATVTVAVMCTGIAYILYFRLIEAAGPSRTLAVTFLIPVFALLYGSLLLHEPVTIWVLISGAVIVLGTALSTGLVRPQTWARGRNQAL